MTLIKQSINSALFIYTAFVLLLIMRQFHPDANLLATTSLTHGCTAECLPLACSVYAFLPGLCRDSTTTPANDLVTTSDTANMLTSTIIPRYAHTRLHGMHRIFATLGLSDGLRIGGELAGIATLSIFAGNLPTDGFGKIVIVSVILAGIVWVIKRLITKGFSTRIRTARATIFMLIPSYESISTALFRATICGLFGGCPR